MHHEPGVNKYIEDNADIIQDFLESCTIAYRMDFSMQFLQKRCPQGVWIAFRKAMRQIGHSYLLSRGGSKSTS